MAYRFDDKTYNRMPFGAPAPFGFGGGVLPLSRVQAGDDFGYANTGFPESVAGLGRSTSSEPTWQVATSDDPTYPYPRPRYAPPLPDVTAPWNPWRRDAERNLTDLWNLLFRNGPSSGGRGSGRDEDCEYLHYEVDAPFCRDVTSQFGKKAGQRCWASAAERYSACNAGRQIPPLDWGNR